MESPGDLGRSTILTAESSKLTVGSFKPKPDEVPTRRTVALAEPHCATQALGDSSIRRSKGQSIGSVSGD